MKKLKSLLPDKDKEAKNIIVDYYSHYPNFKLIANVKNQFLIRWGEFYAISTVINNIPSHLEYYNVVTKITGSFSIVTPNPKLLALFNIIKI